MKFSQKWQIITSNSDIQPSTFLLGYPSTADIQNNCNSMHVLNALSNICVFRAKIGVLKTVQRVNMQI